MFEQIWPKIYLALFFSISYHGICTSSSQHLLRAVLLMDKATTFTYRCGFISEFSPFFLYYLLYQHQQEMISIFPFPSPNYSITCPHYSIT